MQHRPGARLTPPSCLTLESQVTKSSTLSDQHNCSHQLQEHVYLRHKSIMVDELGVGGVREQRYSVSALCRVQDQNLRQEPVLRKIFHQDEAPARAESGMSWPCYRSPEFSCFSGPILLQRSATDLIKPLTSVILVGRIIRIISAIKRSLV